MISQTQGSVSAILDVDTIQDNTEDSKVALLRSVQHRMTTEGKPFLRMMFGDVNGQIIVGRLFNVPNYQELGYALEANCGKYVSISFLSQGYAGDRSLLLKSVSSLKEEYAAQLEHQVKEMHTLRFSSTWSSFVNSLVTIKVFSQATDAVEYAIFQEYSDPDVCAGKVGGICDVVKWTCISGTAAGVPVKTLQAFLKVVKSKCLTQTSADSHQDIGKISFVNQATSMLDQTGSDIEQIEEYNLIAEFTTLFLDISSVRSANTELIFNLYKSFSQYSTISKKVESLPNGGSFSQGGMTYRK